MSDEERYHEYPGIVDLSKIDRYGEPVLPGRQLHFGDDDEEERRRRTFRLLGKTYEVRSPVSR
jgi:hypothetical protein